MLVAGAGGMAALTGAMILGPRQGRFTSGGHLVDMPANNPTSALHPLNLCAACVAGHDLLLLLVMIEDLTLEWVINAGTWCWECSFCGLAGRLPSP